MQGEGAQDAGGPFRDALMDVCEELQSPNSLLPLFIPCPNAQTSSGSNQYVVAHATTTPDLQRDTHNRTRVRVCVCVCHISVGTAYRRCVVLPRVCDRDGYIPRPSATHKNHLAMFEWLGRLIAVGYLAHVRSPPSLPPQASKQASKQAPQTAS
jgi:hypothetical protein